MTPARKLYTNLVCPQTLDNLYYNAEKQELWNINGRIAYPIQNGIPIMVADATRPLTDEEIHHAPK